MPSVGNYRFPLNRCRESVIFGKFLYNDITVSKIGDDSGTVFRCPENLSTESLNIIREKGIGRNRFVCGAGCQNAICGLQGLDSIVGSAGIITMMSGFIDICLERTVITDNSIYGSGLHVMLLLHIGHQKCAGAGVLMFYRSYDAVEVFINR